MIKTLTKTLILASLICAPSAIFASTASDHTDQISLYEQKNTGSPHQYLDMTSRLVPIVQQGGWIKVGVRPSGDVGWINIKQFQQARHQYDKPQSQSFSVNITRDKNDQAHTSITAYRNGKKLSDAEAKALYQSFQPTTAVPIDPWFEAQQRMLNTISQAMQAPLVPPSVPYTVENIPELKPLPIQ